ncbi:enoyl-CoA hydratase-related protein [Rhodoplanes sp. TEM]|uniref:Enoyl-CoA hydratase-related protein n=1 Tax=Rhodoplanes tepidamans TaxID=200616 RepID=A0ABT5J3I3_RHOTP|nr:MULTISPECIES: enoyl-CoA hydratase-related protein [Rhodoplanes]MDC7784216.1 enoyl-CoA hydratase-related protein [Rhodoplanes tepidamans]MDC7987356.1 enoyl-CoA hydratase-related protein [Rhodoplanes sp. TEM]MDQ0356686.1 enoyl-CoA hydratase/carnithine racemase [Rhodoplanes tepidamans]
MTAGPEHPLLLIDRPSDGVAIVRINRPEVRNALNLALRQALAATFRDLAAEPGLRCIVLTGDDKAFCAGADLSEYVDADPVEILERDMGRLWGAIADCPVPVIAAVSGFALGGGCELAMHADIIVAGRSAKFGQPEVMIGITPGGGATQRLTRAVGKFNAMRLMLTGEIVDAEEARAIGLVSRLVDDDAVMAEALRLAGLIVSAAPIAVRKTKELVLESQNVPLDAGLRSERAAFQLTFATRDKHDRMRAFLDRKKGPRR